MRAIGVLILGLVVGCGTVSQVQVHPEYEERFKESVLYLDIQVAAQESMPAPARTLWGTLSQRYANQHRDFIVEGMRMAPGEAQCKEGLQGVLWIHPALSEESGSVHLQLEAALMTCDTGTILWSAVAEGNFTSRDAQLEALRDSYEKEFGPDTGPYVAPLFRMVRDTLGTLPYPKLTRDEDIFAKIAIE